jgi:hypothetical protein
LIISPFLKVIWKTPFEGIQTTLYLSISDEVDHVSGLYFDNSIPIKSSLYSNNKKLIDELWDWSMNELSGYVKDINY